MAGPKTYTANYKSNMGSRCHQTAQLRDIEWPANGLQMSAPLQLVCNGKDVNGFLLDIEFSDGLIYQLVSGFIKAFRTQNKGVRQHAGC